LNDDQFDYFENNLNELFADVSEKNNHVDEIENRLIKIGIRRKDKQEFRGKKLKKIATVTSVSSPESPWTSDQIPTPNFD